MTLPSTPRRAGPYNGNGSATSFAFTFKVFSDEDIRVVRTSSAGVETTLTLDSDYSVTLNGDQDTNPGGSVTYPISGTPLATGQKLTIAGALEYDQPTDIPDGGNFSPTALENALDRISMQVQQLVEENVRSVRLPVSVSGVSVALPTPEADELLVWNSAGTALTNKSVGELATVVAYANWRTSLFDGTGSQTTFTLAVDPANINNLDVVVSGVPQRPTEDYTLAGATLTFTTAPPAGTKNVMVRYGEALPVGVMSEEFARPEAAAGIGVSDGTTVEDSLFFTRPGITGAVRRKALTKFTEDVPHVFDIIPTALHAGIIAGTNLDPLHVEVNKALATGEIVSLPKKGTVHIGAPLDLYSGGGLNGSPLSTIKAVNNFGDQPLIRTITVLPATLAARDSRIYMGPIRVDGNKANNSSATEFSAGIRLRGVNGLHFDRTRFVNCKGDGVTLAPARAEGDGATTYYDIGCSEITGIVFTESCSRQGVAITCADRCQLAVFDIGTSLYSFDIECDSELEYVLDSEFWVFSQTAGNLTSACGGFAVAGDVGHLDRVVVNAYVLNANGQGGYIRNAPGVKLRGWVNGFKTQGLAFQDGGAVPSRVHLDFEIRNGDGSAAVGLSTRETRLQAPVPYTSGLTVALYSTVKYQGRMYTPLRSAAPISTSGTFEASQFRQVTNLATELTGRLLIEDVKGTGANIRYAENGNLDLTVRRAGEQGVILRDCDDLHFSYLESVDNTSHNLWLVDGVTGLRSDKTLSTGAGNFGNGILEQGTSNNNRFGNAIVSGNGNGDVSLSGATSAVEFEPVPGPTIRGDAAATLAARTDSIEQIWSTTLTADRAVTLSTTGAVKGDKFQITRSAGGAFNLNVGTGPLKALAAGQWCVVTYTGSAWALTQFGAL